MNHTEKFNQSVAILVKAYLNDTLEATDCGACAVGNLIAGFNGYQLELASIMSYWVDNGQLIPPQWQDVIWAVRDGSTDTYTPSAEGYRQIESTGYTVEEFGRIEDVFMNSLYHMGNAMPDNYKGLMAVVDCLADIHGIDLATAQASKELFVKA